MVFETKEQLLERACRKGKVEKLKKLLEKYPMLHGNTPVQKDGTSALNVACIAGQLEIVKMLISGKDIDINAISGDTGKTPLQEACSEGKLEIVKILISENADINARAIDGITALQFACWKGHEEIVKFLLSENAEVNTTDDDSESPLSLACRYGFVKVVKMLLEANAEIDTKNKEGYKPGEVFSEDPHHFYPEFEFNFPSEQNQEEIKNVLNEERRKRKKEKKRKVKSQSTSSIELTPALEQEQLSSPEDMALENSKKLPPARCFRKAPELNFEDSLKALLQGPKELPPGRNDLEIADDDLFGSLLYYCEATYEQKMLEHPDLVGLLGRDQALAIIAYTCEFPYKVYFWLNAWLVQDRRDEEVINNVGPFFRLFYQGLENLPRTTLKAGRAVKVKEIPSFRKLFQKPPKKGEKYTFWGVSSFSVEDGVVGEFSGKGEEDAILFSCGDLECVSIEKFSTQEREAEVLPLPPAIFEVSTTIIVNETKLVIALDHKPKDHEHCSYLRPASPKK